MILIDIIMSCLIVMAAYEDAKTQLVGDKITIPFCIFGIAYGFITGRYISSIMAAVILLAVIFIPESKHIGGADIIVMAGAMARFEIEIFLYWMIFACCLSLMVIAVEKLFKVNFITQNHGIAFIVPACFCFIFYIFKR